MGMESRILGYIEEAWAGQATDMAKKELLSQAIREHNEEVLRALPESDEFPPLCRPMFGWPPAGYSEITYRYRLIHFAACVKQIEDGLGEWLDKVEELLRRMYWQRVFIHIQTGYWGTYEFTWRPSDGWLNDLCLREQLRPLTDWTFKTTMDEAMLKEIRG